ncbi:ABC transporter ATP-binding protein [Calidifontibacter indicus]|uniref:Putative ABC transport system ATP-binding protein n=1 Tax=Calidifontibacter indicus TaxID=419650 RepID=A0A3D9UST7_9MICO|nr:ABC transporter ATP-binding protein [Calidifontibacter indicus]REF31573.1 putative ABC transport system ATP-binding protein [Calidifontibacter indicus]
MTLLQARDLSLRLGTTQALQDVSVDLSPGDVVSIMGPSGSGKSTLLHCLAGVLVPDSGSVLFESTDLTRSSDAERSRIRLQRMGFVFQFGDLIPELTMVENVMLPLQLLGTKRSEARDRARTMLDELEVGDVADGTVGVVSGGQAQRTAVARALVHEPAVIFADEPTGALDSAAGELVMDSLVTAAQSRGAAVVLVTHDARVASYAHRNVTMRDGRVRAADLTSMR